MNILKQTVGIDVSYKTFDARFGTIDTQQNTVLSQAKSFQNSLAGFKLFLRWLKKFIVSNDIPLVFVMWQSHAFGRSYRRLL
jgi:hypothetical protein